MQVLRASQLLARLVLAWFALTLGVAALSPMVHPQALELICTSGVTAKLVVRGSEGDTAPVGHQTLDCSACFVATLPPWPVAATLPPAQPLARALQPMVAAHIAALVGAPLPPRGPPACA